MKDKLTKPYHYDKTAFVKKHIYPKVEELQKLCESVNIPYVLGIQSASDEETDSTLFSINLGNTQFPGRILDASARILGASILFSHKPKDMPFEAALLIGRAVQEREKEQKKYEQ